MYYIAYGSNLNKGQMAQRCPAAEPLGSLVLPRARLVFRGVADVEYHDTEQVLCGLWRITERCEMALDRYEGVRSGMYRKEYLPIRLKIGGRRQTGDALIYLMNQGGYYPPRDGYLETIRTGYRDFGLDTKALDAAVKATWVDMAASEGSFAE